MPDSEWPVTCSICNEFIATNRRKLTRHTNDCKKDTKFKKNLIDQYKCLKATENNNNDFVMDDKTCDLSDNGTIFCDDTIANSESDQADNNNDAMSDDEENNYLINKLAHHESNQHKKTKLSEGEFGCGMELLGILNKAKAPLYLFDEIMDWAKKAPINHNHNFDVGSKITREKVLVDGRRKFDLDGLTPKVIPYDLLHTKKRVGIVRFDALECVYSLLRMFNKQEHRLPLHPDDLTILGDINTGETFQKGVRHYIGQDEKTKELVGIIIFIDKTHTDTHGRLCLEPVMMTLTCFNRETRQNPKAWHTLGYVTDLITVKGGDTSLKAQDYHNMLDIILQPLKNMQKRKIMFFRRSQETNYLPCSFCHR